MLEIELKYRHDNLDALRAVLQRLGVVPLETRRDADHYFNAPDRDFAQTDEAFRIRRIGAKNLLTFKGPKIDAQTKTRMEIEIPFADGDAIAGDMAKMLTALGYRSVAIVGKSREVFGLSRGGFEIHICLDAVDKVGTFVEVEIVAPESQLESARTVLFQLADELSLKDSERRSYLQLLLERTSA